MFRQNVLAISSIILTEWGMGVLLENSLGWLWLLSFCTKSVLKLIMRMMPMRSPSCVSRSKMHLLKSDEPQKRIADMSGFLKKQHTALTEYDEQHLLRLTEKVTVCEDKFTLKFKSGVTVGVDE